MPSTYIGLLVDKTVAYEDREGFLEWRDYMEHRAVNHGTWPGVRVAEKLICKIC